jgi:hypothetical protein
MGARRVWVHTGTLGHPHALANDQARGFRIVWVKERIEALPHEPLPPWSGATLPVEDCEAANPQRRGHHARRGIHTVGCIPHKLDFCRFEPLTSVRGLGNRIFYGEMAVKYTR